MSIIAAVHMKKIFATFLLLAPLAALAHQVVHIADGDSLTLQVGRKRLKLRLAGIDAPEMQQSFGRQARQSLYQLCWGKDAQYDSKAIDRFGRTVASLRCNGIDAGRAQVERGMAWAASRGRKNTDLQALETAARRQKTGLWADARPLAPWKFRHAPAATATCQTGPRGGRYQWIAGRKIYGC